MPTEHDISQVNSEVGALLQSERLSKSPALLELLSYLKDRYANRTDDPTTEYAIAQDLLQRDASFDPKSDPVVRVRIRRLRDALNQYYDNRTAGVCLSIPSRSYDLDLTMLTPLATTAKPRGYRRRATIAAAFMTVTVIAYLLFWLPQNSPQSGYPLIGILPIQNLTGNPDNDIFENGLQRQIASDLQRFGQFRVYAYSPTVEDANEPDFILRGSILQLDGEIDLAFRLEQGEDARLVFGDRIKGELFGQNYFEAIAAISSEISGKIASRGGPLLRANPQTELLEAGLLSFGGIGLDVFECIVLEDTFFEDYDADVFIAAYRCFENVVPKIEDDPVALSNWGTLVFHTVPEFDLMQTDLLPPEILHEVDSVLAMATEIAERFPQSSDAFLLLGSVQSAAGQLARADFSLQQAISLNPGDSTAHAVLSYLELSRENFENAIMSADEAINLSANPQGFIFFPIFVSALVLGDEQRAIEAGDAYSSQRTGDGATVIRLITARLRGNQEVVDHLSPTVAAMSNPLAGFSSFIRGERTFAALSDMLPEADLTDR